MTHELPLAILYDSSDDIFLISKIHSSELNFFTPKKIFSHQKKFFHTKKKNMQSQQKNFCTINTALLVC